MSSRDTAPPSPPARPRPSRLRRFFLRHVPLGIACLVVLCGLALTGFYFWASSAQCERLVRRWLVAKVEAATGGRVEIASFEWHLLRLEADAGGVVIHGLEAPGEAPYAQISNLRVRLSVLGLMSPRIVLRSLDISQPSFHLIVYPDGTTNQPHPRRPPKRGKPAIETLFEAQAGRVSVEQGVVDLDTRAAAFDFQNRFAPLDFKAEDVSLRMRYVPAEGRSPETYRIETGATGLNFSRVGGRSPAETAHGRLQATIDLTRTGVILRALRLTAGAKKGSGPVLNVSGTMEDFARPRWQARAWGDLDMDLIDPLTGFPYAPAGIAHVDLIGAGAAGEFRLDGSVHVDGGSYIGTGVNATGVRLDAHLHADPKQLLITSIAAHLRQGGEIDGTLALTHWLPPIPGAAVLESQNAKAAPPSRKQVHTAFVHPKPIFIPVDGKVTATLKNVALDTILDMVSRPPYQRLGLDARLNGPAAASWSSGSPRTTVVSATLALTPSAQPVAGENPTSGTIDATYTQRDGSVDLRKLDLEMPGTRLAAHGHLGAYPVDSPTVIMVNFQSRNLFDFDTVLRALGLHRNGKAGIAALPVALSGEADFQGLWTGSLVNPHLAGNLKATQLAVEMPAPRAAGQGNPAPPRMFTLDAADVTGSYSSVRIAIQRALLVHGRAKIAASGTLEAEQAGNPGLGADSRLHARLEVGNLSVEEMQPFLARRLPVTGLLDAHLALDGPLHAPGGSGWVELGNGSVYGEPLARIRAQGSLAGQVLHLTSVSMTAPAGSIAGSGSYSLASRSFQMQASGAGIDLSRIAWLQRQDLEAAGKLRFSASGSGTLSDPRLNGEAVLSGVSLSGEPLGGVELSAHTANSTLIYDATTRIEGAPIAMHGQTQMNGAYNTQARLEFSSFNIAELLKLAHVEGLTGDSSLAGTVAVNGPLAHLAQMRGEATLRELAVTVAGVHLKSEGGLHATLADSRLNLDPLHITGEDTDLHMQGSLALAGERRLDFAGQGSVNLKLAETLDPDLTAGGTTTFQVEAHGPLRNPGLQGRIDFQNGSLSLGDVPNGLSQLHGSLVFNQNRLEVKTLTAMSGGGLLSVGGFLAYQRGIFADLSVTGMGIRIRYPAGVSSLADITLHLHGQQNNLLLSGNVLITRFTISPDLDIASLAAQASAATQSIAPPEAPSNHVRLDVHVVSSPQLNFQNAYAKLAGDVNLHLRGTVANPSLLGQVSITEGNAMIAGTRYELQRGEVTFTNPVQIEPNIDLSATAHVEDYDITLGLHGTPSRLAVNYRSDPPLPESDVLSLLALGHTENQQRLYTQQQEQALTNPTTDALLGGALNATVSSRVQKLFGAGSVRIDPNYLGALGNSTSRITVQEQLGRNVTLTYATDVDTTGQQLLQAEIAVNRHVSLVVARDESGVFSMVIKATRRYR